MTPEELCRRFAGTHYRDPAFCKAAEAMDWNNRWPLIDRDGDLTGDVTEGDDSLNVDGEAMILPEEARAGRWEVDIEEGSAKPPRRELT